MGSYRIGWTESRRSTPLCYARDDKVEGGDFYGELSDWMDREPQVHSALVRSEAVTLLTWPGFVTGRG